MNPPAAIRLENLSHSYGRRQALCELSLEIASGEIFVFLGPNGGGKTTLFRVLSTLIPQQSGTVEILGLNLRRDTTEIRRRIGVVFQAPSLDRKLTIAENIHQQAALYGLFGAELRHRRDELLDQFALKDRAGERVEKLSGGLRRRVELAKGMIHRPELLLLDEPSTGLDPGARADLWEYLQRARQESGVTIVLTTHLLEEADESDRIAILNEGQLVALDTPDALRSSVGGDLIVIESAAPDELAAGLRSRLSLPAQVVEGTVRLETPEGHQWVARIVEEFPGSVGAIRLGKPTLEDVFIARTGHRFWRERQEAAHA
ncbi:MAG: ATP-binding cassette domain-containing protein [Pirellulaceae bacterium]